MLKSLWCLGLATLVAGTALAEEPLGKVGESVQIWRHRFGSDLRFGREAIIRDMVPMLSRDRLTRSTIIAENTTTGDLVVVHFSDAYHLARRDNMPWKDFEVRMKNVHELGRNAVSSSNFQVFAVHDEGVVAKPGALLMLWSRKVLPGKHPLVRQHLMNQLLPRLSKDGLRRTLYFAEGYDEGELLNIGISDALTSGERHRQLNDLVKQHYREPVKVETFRIVSVTRERTR